MNPNVFESKWKQMHGEVKGWWENLTDDDLEKVDGKFENFASLLQERYGYDQQQAEEEWEERTKCQIIRK